MLVHLVVNGPHNAIWKMWYNLEASDKAKLEFYREN